MQRSEYSGYSFEFSVINSEDPANDRISHVLIRMTIATTRGLQRVWYGMELKKWIYIVGPQPRKSGGIFYKLIEVVDSRRRHHLRFEEDPVAVDWLILPKNWDQLARTMTISLWL